MRILLKSVAGLALFIVAALLYYQFWFLRLPDRDVPDVPGSFISPANGKVVAVVAWDRDSLAWEKDAGVVQVITTDLGDRGWLIAIEMDVTNVHYQRAPASGRFVRAEYVKGRFNNALIQTNCWGLRLENERNDMLFETADGLPYKVVQVAGLLARRIEGFMEPGQSVSVGDLIGLIKLGSQVALVLPENAIPLVAVGEKVVDGLTLLAKLDPEK